MSKSDLKYIETACRLLELYDVAPSVNTNEIRNFKTYQSNIYGMANIYSFQYKDNHYYICDDHSLMDNPKFIKNVLKQFNSNIKGWPLRNPLPQSDGAIYALGLDETEYYLWEAPLE